MSAEAFLESDEHHQDELDGSDGAESQGDVEVEGLTDEDTSETEEGEDANLSLMADSGLSENDRRELRKKQRQLLRDIADHDSLGVKEARKENISRRICFM